MPTASYPSAKIPITCPKCGHQFSKTVREIKTKANFSCPKCGVLFDPKGLASSLEEVDKSLDKLRRDVAKMFKGR
uniref:DUF7836 domain-containing protein n=1 Tax=viral metagenome TaxID=1070528 RepID=A0A6M3K931_9ZZZZ